VSWSISLSTKGGPEAKPGPVNIQVAPINYGTVQNIAGQPDTTGGLGLPPLNRLGFGLDQLGTQVVHQGSAPFPTVYPLAQYQVDNGEDYSNFLPGATPALWDTNTYQGPSTFLILALILGAGIAAFSVAKFT